MLKEANITYTQCEELDILVCNSNDNCVGVLLGEDISLIITMFKALRSSSLMLVDFWVIGLHHVL